MRDHERLSGLLVRLRAATEANERDDMLALWNELDVGLNTHLEVEEKYLFPTLARIDPAAERSLRTQHESIRKKLLDLGMRVELHTVRLDATEEFLNELAAHAMAEDQILYRFADENVDDASRGAALSTIESRGRSTLRSSGEKPPRGAAPL
jgi:hemerythrin-like domain-containing protein